MKRTNSIRFPIATKDAVKRAFPRGIEKLEFGAGNNPEDGYIHMDIQKTKHLEILSDVRKTPIPANFVKTEIRAVHIMEHFCHPEFASDSMKKSIGTTVEVLEEAYRILAPGGSFFMVTPDYAKICQSAAEERIPFDWLQRWSVGGHLNMFDVHHWLWTKKDAEKWFAKVGFVQLQDCNPIQGWFAERSLNWTAPELGANPDWYKTEWYHWLFFKGVKPER